jgi:hypothetical protein
MSKFDETKQESAHVHAMHQMPRGANGEEEYDMKYNKYLSPNSHSGHSLAHSSLLSFFPRGGSDEVGKDRRTAPAAAREGWYIRVLKDNQETLLNCDPFLGGCEM